MASHHFWSIHQHSRFSNNDALPSVPSIVAKAHALGYPALGLTDHGSVAGVVQLYKECRKIGIEPLPGVEAYVTPDTTTNARKFNHLTIAAYTETGYRNLVHLVNRSQANFHYRPRLDLIDFADAYEAGRTEGLLVATGCYFGMVQTLMRDRGYDGALRVVKALAQWFPRCYVEIMHHGIYTAEHDSSAVAQRLHDMAAELGLPTIVTSDAHYVEPSDRHLHDGLKRLVSFSDDPDDAVFPGESGYHMPDTTQMGIYLEPHILGPALANLAELAETACVRLPELENFHLQVPDVTFGADPDTILRKKVNEAYAKSEFWSSTQASSRIEEELEVIETAGMAQYMLLVADVCEFMLSSGIWFHARGSASGSLVTRLLGITQIDPLAWNLRFDRFLSRDRTRPPDVDLDVAHDGRAEVARYLESRYVVRQISTHMTYSIKGDEDLGEESKRGSLMVRYHSLAGKRGQPHRSWHQIPAHDQNLLEALGDMDLFSGYGTHPAGFVLAADTETIARLPLTYIASSKTLVTSFDKKDIETLGMVKLDVLGLKEVTAMRIACGIAGVDLDSIPMNDKATFLKIAKGDTDGVFQLKGYATRKGCQSIKPKRMEDLAAAQALFRPAAMNSGATAEYRDRRRGVEKVPVRHRDIMTETKETYGVLLYQEQVISVLRNMGMPAEELTDFLDAVKASTKKGIAEARKTIQAASLRIAELANARGWNDEDITWLLHAVAGSAEYGFNKAHAATYATVAYRSAWMSEHHPVAFWTGMLTVYSGTDRESEFVQGCRRAGVKVLGAKVNLSGYSYTAQVERHAVRRGLRSIKGVGVVAANELIDKGPFRSLRDLGEKCVAKKVSGAKHLALGKSPAEAGGVIGALFDAGALDQLPDDHTD